MAQAPDDRRGGSSRNPQGSGGRGAGGGRGGAVGGGSRGAAGGGSRRGGAASSRGGGAAGSRGGNQSFGGQGGRGQGSGRGRGEREGFDGRRTRDDGGRERSSGDRRTGGERGGASEERPRGGAGRPQNSGFGSRGRRDERSPRDDRGSRNDRPYRSRDDRGGGERRPYRGRDDQSDRNAGGPREGRGVRDERSREGEEFHLHPGLAPKENEPETPTDINERDFPRQMRAELRGLPSHLAQAVGAHLMAAGALIDEDPQLAYAHAEAARRRAARLPIVREATAETAYAAGEYAAALNEFRALRRMTGGNEYTPVMADCERALGRPDAALRLIEEARRAPGFGSDPVQATELLMVEAGARADRGQVAEALRLLKQGIHRESGPASSRARLRYAYADLLLATGDEAAAKEWFAASDALDVDRELDADDRVAALDGVVMDLDLSDDDEDDDDEKTSPDDNPTDEPES